MTITIYHSSETLKPYDVLVDRPSVKYRLDYDYDTVVAYDTVMQDRHLPSTIPECYVLAGDNLRPSQVALVRAARRAGFSIAMTPTELQEERRIKEAVAAAMEAYLLKAF